MTDPQKLLRMRLKTVAVSIACLLGAAAGGFFLHQDIHQLGEGSSGDPIGQVERKEAKVRRKASSSFVWNNIQDEESLFRKDSIQTGRSSAVTVRLADGGTLDIGENSLVVMDDITNLALGFVRGTAVVHRADGDSKISVGEDGKAKVETLPARLIEPESLGRFFVTKSDPSKKVTFVWESRKASPDSPYEVQVSLGNQFHAKSTKTLRPSPGQGNRVSLALKAGVYYWRVLTGSSIQTETRMFRVHMVEPVPTVSPAVRQKVVSATDEPEVQFRWVIPTSESSHLGTASYGKHFVEVAKDPEFRSISVSSQINLSSGIANLKDVPQGVIYWRIRSSYSDVTVTSPSVVFMFTHQPAPESEPLLPAPQKATPEPGAVIDVFQEDARLEATWSRVSGAKKYEVTVYQVNAGSVSGLRQAGPGALQTSAGDDGKDGKKEIIRSVTADTQLSLKKLGAGNYVWSIRAIDRDDRPGESLPLRGFTLDYGELLDAPEVLTPEVQ